jgi:hypothetical protein
VWAANATVPPGDDIDEFVDYGSAADIGARWGAVPKAALNGAQICLTDSFGHGRKLIMCWSSPVAEGIPAAKLKREMLQTPLCTRTMLVARMNIILLQASSAPRSSLYD